ncbi:MAG TPA: PhoH family protein [Clostridia bacterium]|nr:PhoH family protein [Clostridia bacterium]
MSQYREVRFTVGTNGEALNVFGIGDENLRYIESQTKVKIVARGNEVVITGEDAGVELTKKLLQELVAFAQDGSHIDVGTVNYVLNMLSSQDEEPKEPLADALSDVIYVTPRGKKIRPKTLGQKNYIQAIKNYDIVFGIGPAGTGKTYLAVIMAVNALKNKEVSRIILTRPAVEAGEKLGFLPGDLQEKVNPYLRPLYDSLYDALGMDKVEKYLERTVIEIAPLAYMRGRTLDDAFIILDEAQNTTPEQMKMFLTRIGFDSKAVITGDVTQVDLPKGQYSGLVEAQEVLKGLKGISFQYLTEADVVRHPLVQEIIKAYEQFAQGKAAHRQEKS